MNIKLLTKDNAKTKKGELLGWRTAILYLAPHEVHKDATQEVIDYAESRYDFVNKIKSISLCPWATECKKYCLYKSGRGRFSSVEKGRLAKTLYFLSDRNGFNGMMLKELSNLAKLANKGQNIAVRLNGTSDIVKAWDFAKMFPELQFYDYTKSPARMRRFCRGDFPANYHLTYSFHEGTDPSFMSFLQNENKKRRKAKMPLVRWAKIYEPEEYDRAIKDQSTLAGDNHDLRFLDQEENPESYIVALRKKAI